MLTKSIRLSIAVLLMTFAAVGSAPDSIAQTFHDDFDGDAIDLTKWNLDLGGGTASVSEGTATLSVPSCGQFPYLTSKSNPFPLEGDFVLRVGFRYPAVGGGGTGFGPDWVQRDGFWVWQDSGSLWAQIGDVTITLSSVADTSYHIYEWRYVGGTYSLTVDGQFKGSDQSSFRPSSIFFGHVPYGYCNWTTQQIDFVDVQQIRPTATQLTTSPNPSLCPEEVTLVAMVNPSQATGRVDFLDGADVIASATLLWNDPLSRHLSDGPGFSRLHFQESETTDLAGRFDDESLCYSRVAADDRSRAA